MMAEFNKVIFVLTLILVCWLSGVFSVCTSCRKRCRENNLKNKGCGDNFVCRNDSAEPPVGRCYQSDIDNCSPNPCENGATCIDDGNSYNCNCTPGYNGTNCSEQDLDVCNLGSCFVTTGICFTGSMNHNCAAFGGYLEATIYLNATNALQELISPGYPDGYCDKMNILWLIFAENGKKIEIKFTDIVLEKGSDWVKVADELCCDSENCTDELGSFSGITDPDLTGEYYIPTYDNTLDDDYDDYGYNYHADLAAQLLKPINSSSNVMTINFRSDSSISARGFHLEYRQVD